MDYSNLARQARGVAYKILRSSADAEDVSQDTIIRILRAKKPLDASTAGVYVRVIATNLAIDKIRKFGGSLTHGGQWPLFSIFDSRVRKEVEQKPMPGPDARAELIEAMRKAMAGVPPVYREVLELEGVDDTEIKVRLGLSLDNVRQRRCRGIKRLREALGVRA